MKKNKMNINGDSYFKAAIVKYVTEFGYSCWFTWNEWKSDNKRGLTYYTNPSIVVKECCDFLVD